MKKKLVKEENGIRYFNNGDWIDLSSLPRRKSKNIDWQNSVGKSGKFYTENKEYEYIITRQNSETCHVFFNIKGYDEEFCLPISTFRDCKFKNFVTNRKKYLYEINDIVNGVKILRQIRVTVKDNTKLSGYTTEKGYLIKCLKDGFECETIEYHLKNGGGCPVCAGKRLVVGINDVATTHPHLVKYFKNPDDAHKYTHGTNKKVSTICPYCGYDKKNMKVNNLTRDGFSCPKCGDKLTFPNKFITAFLLQLNVDFVNEQIFEWSKNVEHENNKISGVKKYDFYIPSLSLIIEAHGGQHYNGRFFTMKKNARNLEEEQENDRVKRELALSNGIKYYIELDCRKSEMEWIKQSIMDSDLVNLFDLSNVCWQECILYTQKNISKEACDLWNSGVRSTSEIGDIIKMSPSTVRNYLKKWNSIGLCDYTGETGKKESDRRIGDRNRSRNNKKVYVYDYKTMTLLKEYESAKTCEEQSEKDFGVKIRQGIVSSVATGVTKFYKGFFLSYVKIEDGKIPNNLENEDCCKSGKSIYVYYKTCEFIKWYPNIGNCSRNSEKDLGTPFTSSQICLVANGIKEHIKGFIFSFKELTQEELEIVKQKNFKTNKKDLYLYNLEGKLITKYESISECVRQSKNEFHLEKPFDRNGITRAMKNKRSYKDVVFSYKELTEMEVKEYMITKKNNNKETHNKKNLKTKQTKPVYVYTKDKSILLKEYPSVMECERKSMEDFNGVQFNNGCISNVANGKKSSHKGYFFSYIKL